MFHQFDDVQEIEIGNGDLEDGQGGVFLDLHFGPAPGKDGIELAQVIFLELLQPFIDGAHFHGHIQLGIFFGCLEQDLFQAFVRGHC